MSKCACNCGQDVQPRRRSRPGRPRGTCASFISGHNLKTRDARLDHFIANWPRCPDCQSLVTWCSLRCHNGIWGVRWTCGVHEWAGETR